jgi:hypothetical protein
VATVTGDDQDRPALRVRENRSFVAPRGPTGMPKLWLRQMA